MVASCSQLPHHTMTHPSVCVRVLSTITNDNRTVGLAHSSGRQGGYLQFVPQWPTIVCTLRRGEQWVAVTSQYTFRRVVQVQPTHGQEAAVECIPFHVQIWDRHFLAANKHSANDEQWAAEETHICRKRTSTLSFGLVTWQCRCKYRNAHFLGHWNTPPPSLPEKRQSIKDQPRLL